MENSFRYPHLKGSILNLAEENGTLNLHLCADTKKHTYLKEHIFGEHCFIPATMIMELLFEAVFYYYEFVLKKDMNNITPYKLKKLSIMRSFEIIPGEKMDFHIVAKDKGEEQEFHAFETLIYSDRFNKNKEVIGVRNNVTADVLIGTMKQKYEPIDIPKFKQEEFHIETDKLYHRFFPSLGYHFQTCQQTFKIDVNRRFLIGEYNLSNKELSCIKEEESCFLTSPLGNDACLQIAVFLSRVINLIGRLPIGGEEIEFYRKNSLSSNVNVLVECLEIDKDMLCNITAYDKDGVLVRMKRFTVRKSPYHTTMERDEFDTWINHYRVII